MNELENIKKKLLYRSNYRGTKEMDLLLNTFVKKYINQLDKVELKELEKFLDFEDEIIFNFYYYDIVKENIDKNKISNLFKKHLI